MNDRSGLSTAPTDIAALFDSLIGSPAPTPVVDEVGTLISVSQGVAAIAGLDRALAEECLRFTSGAIAIAADLTPGRLSAILLDAPHGIRPGEAVYRTHKVIKTPVGEALLGRVVDPLGRPLDSAGPVSAEFEQSIEQDAIAILDRAQVTRPLATGITAIDAAIPIGLGQRELIIGDRQTGKTSIAVDAILNQAASDLLCVYCAIGQRGDATARVISAIDNAGMRKRVIVVAASGESGPGMNYIAPFAATTMAEHFAATGRDVLIVYDDLTRHAHSYRELSLLLRHPPGREAYPGDIFYLHARLLERAAQYCAAKGGGSLTALPIVETQTENLAAYIPTNLISITDGQVYLSPTLMRKGQLPAIDLGRSVSRVGGKAQAPAMREVAADLRITLAQFEELESFARFGTRLDDTTRQRLAHGAAVRAALRQPEHAPIPTAEQIAVLLCAMDGAFDAVSLAQATTVHDALREASRDGVGAIHSYLASGQVLGSVDRNALLACAREATSELEQHGNADQ